MHLIEDIISEKCIRCWNDLLWWRGSFEWEVNHVAKQVKTLQVSLYSIHLRQSTSKGKKVFSMLCQIYLNIEDQVDLIANTNTLIHTTIKPVFEWPWKTGLTLEEANMRDNMPLLGQGGPKVVVWRPIKVGHRLPSS